MIDPIIAKIPLSGEVEIRKSDINITLTLSDYISYKN